MDGFACNSGCPQLDIIRSRSKFQNYVRYYSPQILFRYAHFVNIARIICYLGFPMSMQITLLAIYNRRTPMRNDDHPKKTLATVLLSVCVYLINSSGISINLSNNSMNYIQNQTNNYYHSKDDDKT